ncbi:MAG TPA: AraC family transcriptional regulator [Pseudomonas sp.]|nr:AraC family transcriptional regulator [Pseudomonas sp.]
MQLPMQLTIYHCAQRFLLLAPTFVLDRSPTPYRRLSATLLIACKEPFHLEIGDGILIHSQVALIGPKVLRKRLIAPNSNLAIFDVPIQAPEFSALNGIMLGQPVITPSLERFAHLLPALARAFDGLASHAEVRALFKEAINVLMPAPREERPLNPRVAKAIALIDQQPLNSLTLEYLASQLHLSPSRLRHLFKEETGSSIRQFSRENAVRRAIALWTQGRSLTDVAHETGLYDVAHLHHAFVEMFGMNPSTLTDPRSVILQCVKD